MIIILGLILLVLAAIVAVAGIVSNAGSGHEFTYAFAVFGHQMTGFTGMLFLYGMIDSFSRRERDRQDRGCAQSLAARDDDAPRADTEPTSGDGHHHRLHLFGHRPAHR